MPLPPAYPAAPGPVPAWRDERGVVVPSRLMLIAILVVAVGAFVYVATSPGKPPVAASSDRTAASGTASASGSATGSATASRSARPSASASSKASTSAKATASATAKATRSPSASASPKASAPAQAVRRGATFVEVFNNTKRKGLAGRAATKAEGVGWKVVGSDNWYGTIPSSTVYYPKRYAQAAKALARDLGITRVEAAVAPMRNDRLTVILTSDYRVR